MNIQVISLIGILVGLGLLMYLAFKGFSLLIIGPLCAVIVLLFSGVDIVENMTGPFSESFANFAKSNFLLFLLSSIFGETTGDSGAAKIISYKAVRFFSKSGKNQKFYTLVTIGGIIAVLSVAGISSFVVVFTMVAICKNIFEKLDIPWHFFISTLAFGAQLFTPTYLPGAATIQNLMPIQYLGTTAMAGPWLGILGTIVAILLSLIYWKITLNKSEKEHEGFFPTGKEISKVITESEENDEEISKGSMLKSLTPAIVLLVSLNAFSFAPVAALLLGVVVSIVLFWKEYDNVWKTMANGANNAIRSMCGVCAMVAFGGIVKVVPGFDFVVGGLDKIPGPPIVQLVVAANIAAGITGSGTGGLGIALETFADKFLSMGIRPEVIHRVVAMSATGLDSMPHNGAINNNLTTSHLTHKEAYKHCFWLTLVIPIIVSVTTVIFAEMGIV